MKVTKWRQAIAIVGKLKQFNNYFDYDHQPDEHQENSQKNQQTIDSSSCLDTVWWITTAYSQWSNRTASMRFQWRLIICRL